ncbi:MAG: TonB-dependent receptor, partial [Deltaproteobacteria bacterium]|nr:TonB-dependent receptor [Deltaproteobacteria bacterium]
GNFPVRYGGATAGVVDVGSKNQRVEQFGGEVDVNLINVAAYAETPIGRKVSARFAIRRSYVDAVLPAVLDLAGQDSTTVVPVYWDYQAKISWFPNLEQRVSVFAFGSDDQLRLASTSKRQDLDVDVGFQTSFHRLAAEWALSRRSLRVRVAPDAGWDYFTFGADETFVDGNAWSAGVRTEVTWLPVERLRLTFGNDSDWSYPRFQGRLPIPKNYYQPGSTVSAGFDVLFSDDTEPFQRADHYGFLGFYVEASWRPWDVLELLPGFRTDVILFPGEGDGAAMVTWDPRFTLRYTPHPAVTVKAGVGKFSRPPDFQFLDRDFGNPHLRPEWADQYSLGVEWSIWGPLVLDTQGFFVRRHDRAVASEDFSLGSAGVENKNFESTGEGRAYGWELLFKVKPEGRFYGWIAYTLSVSEERDTRADDWILTFFDQTHILSVVGSVQLGRGWETGLRFRLISGKPVTPIRGATFVADRSSYLPFTGRLFSDRLEPFIQLDVRVEKRWTFKKWSLSTYLDVQNVTNNPNSEFQQWDYRFRRSSTIPSVPIFPTIGLNAKW